MPKEKSLLAEHRTGVARMVTESYAAVENALREADHAWRHAAGLDPVEVAEKLLAVTNAKRRHASVIEHYRTAVLVLDQVEGELRLQKYEAEHPEPTAAEPVVPFKTEAQGGE